MPRFDDRETPREESVDLGRRDDEPLRDAGRAILRRDDMRDLERHSVVVGIILEMSVSAAGSSKTISTTSVSSTIRR